MDYNIFPKSGNKTNGGVIGIILVVILLAILVNVKPNYFKYLFKSFLGNLILAFAIIVIGIMDVKWGIGFAAIAFIIYQAFQISCVQVEGLASNTSTCKPGCAAPTKPTGNCKVSNDKKTLSCPWECTTDPSNYKFDKYGRGSANCVYSSECASCGSPLIFNNSPNGQQTAVTGASTASASAAPTDSMGKTVATASKPDTGVTSSTTSRSLFGLFP